MFYKIFINKIVLMKNKKKIDNRIYSALLEYYSKNIIEDDNNLSQPENEFIDYVLGENIDEANGSEILNRFMNVLNSGKKKIITAAVMTTLMANPAFSSAVEKAPDNVKSQITQLMGDESNQNTDSNKTLDTQQDKGGNYKSKDSLFTINFYNNFKSGSYEVNSEEAYAKLEDLKTYLSQNKDNKFKINIIASESQVPNQSGFKIGELANKRAQVMNQLVTNYVNQNKLGDIDIHMDTNIGDVPWDGKNKNDKKYVKDQYVVLEVVITSAAPCELAFTKKGEQAKAEDDFISYKQPIKGNGSINLSPSTIPDRMQIVKNGQVIGDTDYYVDKKHNYEQWKYVPLYVASLSELLSSNPESSAIKGTKQIKHFDDYNELIKFMLKDGVSYKIKDDSRTEIRNGLDKLEQLWNSGQRDFVFYSFKKGTIEFQIQDNETGGVLVYSPIGSTGFSLNGNCE